MAYSYSVASVFDVDQRWTGLEAEGVNHCVPASFINWMYYFAMKGRLTAIPYANGQPNHIRKNIDALGEYMDTDGDSGTSPADAVDGLVEWGADRNVPYWVSDAHVRDNDNISYKRLRNLLKSGAYVVVKRGKYELEDGVFDRVGGHAMSLVRFSRTDDNVITIGVHNPWSGGSITSQASFQVETVTLTERRRNIEGEELTVLRWGPESVNPPYHCIDGWTALTPMFAVSNVSPRALTRYIADIATGDTSQQDFPLPFDGGVSDLVLDPSLAVASVIAEASGEVWTLDLAEGSWNRVADITGARRLVYGGRRQRLFVVRGSEVAAFDGDGQLVGRLDAGLKLDALTYDAARNRLVGLGGDKLLSVDPQGLNVVGHTEAPVLSGQGRLSISMDPLDGSVILSRSGSPEFTAVRGLSGGRMSRRRLHLRGAGPNSGAQVASKGRMVVSDGGRIATFGAEGARVQGSVFDGLAAGPLLKVSRTVCNIDRERTKLKKWRN
jgi:hypothetical protein